MKRTKVGNIRAHLEESEERLEGEENIMKRRRDGSEEENNENTRKNIMKRNTEKK